MDIKNYLDELTTKIKQQNKRPRLLLHSCCAPCSSYVLEYLSEFFEITVFYYNPNIYPPEEFEKRLEEQKKYSTIFANENIDVVDVGYDQNEFYSAVKGLENEPEGGRRCEKCFYIRLEKTCQYAKKHGFDYFTTTLSISPHKNAELLNETGAQIAEKYGVSYLFSDFKKKNGYLRSCELSKQYNIYRQNYCGCIFSKKESESRNK